jgi:[histone H3]-lysine36 N-dimethyltransferase SETMAR
LERLNDEIKTKCPQLKKKKVLFHQNNAQINHKSIKSTAKLHELDFKLFLHPPYSPDLAPSDFFLFADLNRMLAGKKFSTNVEVIAETEGYFEAILKSYNKNGIKKLYDHYNRCIALERNNIA